MNGILIVDDKPSKYGELLGRLSAANVDKGLIAFSTSVRDGLDRLRAKVFDVLIVDMLLPETPWGDPVPDGGAQLLTHLREDPELKTPKYIIGVTAAAEDDEEVRKVFDSQPWLLMRTTGGGNPWEDRLSRLILHALDIERTQDALEFGIDICFMAALRTPELEALLETGVQLNSPELVDSTTFARNGTLQSNGRVLKIAAANCLRMGSTESALLASKLIHHFRPRILIVLGICAGYEDKVDYGDVIVADPCWDYTSAKISTDGTGHRTVAYSPDFIGIDSDIRTRLEMLAEDKSFLASVHATWKGDKPRAAPEVRVAPSATGPAVIADAKVLEDIRRFQHRQTIGLEMEAYGVYCAVRMATRPRPIVVSAKAVCDFSTFLKDDKYQKYAAYTSASVVMEFCRRYGSELVDLIR
jgi:nucleoside phosphorylase